MMKFHSCRAAMSDIKTTPHQREAPWRAQSKLVREKLLQDSLTMFVDLGLTPREMSRAANLPLEVIEDGLKLSGIAKSSSERCVDGRSGRVQETRATDIEAQQKEADHRIANSIQLAAAMLNNARRGICDVASAQAALDGAMLRLMAIARTHRQLSQDVPDGTVDLARFLKPFCADITQSIGAIFKISAKNATLRATDATQVCIILNELAMNAVKHCGLDGKPVILTLEAVRNGRGPLRITLRDNGRGLPKGFSLQGADGLGMTIVTSAVEKLGGSLRPLYGAGAGFEIDLPQAGGANSIRSSSNLH